MDNKFFKLLKDNDLKITKNKIAVLQELERRETPATAEEIFNVMARSRKTKYSLSSVYRALNNFYEKSIIKKTAEIDGTTYFQLNLGEHIHSLICEKCKKIIPINHCPIYPLIKDIETKTDFIITGHYLEIKGICKSCQKKYTKEELNNLKEKEPSEHKCKNENCI